jgi:hypothetical protein
MARSSVSRIASDRLTDLVEILMAQVFPLTQGVHVLL